eukprot:COSAG01_NODE_13281_length_1607_cov_3.791114_1_plen_134_part_10
MCWLMMARWCRVMRPCIRGSAPLIFKLQGNPCSTADFFVASAGPGPFRPDQPPGSRAGSSWTHPKPSCAVHCLLAAERCVRDVTCVTYINAMRNAYYVVTTAQITHRPQCHQTRSPLLTEIWCVLLSVLVHWML